MTSDCSGRRVACRTAIPAAGTVASTESTSAGIKASEPGSTARNWSLKTRMEKNEFVAAANSSGTGLVIRALLPFNPLRSRFIVTLPFSTIIF